MTLGLLSVTGAAAQFPQYTAPGSLAVPQTPTEERIEQGVEEARWDLGALKVDPRFWVRQLGYNDNVFGATGTEQTVGDLTATGGAGLVAFSNLGSDVVVSLYLLPEYTWWRDQTQLREEHLNYGVGVFGFYNRLTLILDASRDDRQRLLSSESLVPFDIRRDLVSIEAAIDLHGPFELFGGAEARDFEHAGSAAGRTGVTLETLDREEVIGRLGVAYRFPSDLRIGLGAEYSQTDFPIDPAGRSNTTLGPLLEIVYDADKVDLAATLVLREVEFDGIASPTRTVFSGKARAGWQAGHRLRLDGYAGRSLVYSVFGADRFFTEQRFGASVGTPWGRRFHVRAFGETGTDEYDRVGAVQDSRRDDVTAFGAELDFELTRRFVLSVGGSSTEYDSNQPGSNREVTALNIGLRVGGDPRPW